MRLNNNDLLQCVMSHYNATMSHANQTTSCLIRQETYGDSLTNLWGISYIFIFEFPFIATTEFLSIICLQDLEAIQFVNRLKSTGGPYLL